MRKSLWIGVTSVWALTSAIVPFGTEPVLAETGFPITEIRWWHRHPEEPWQSIGLTVPDQDTTVSAYGGELRLYDVHLAKMVEVTHYLCQQEHHPNRFDWLKNVLFSQYSSDQERKILLESFLKGQLNQKGFSWDYGAANDNVNMGRFKISCQLASEIITAYGLSQSNPSVVLKVKADSRQSPTTYSVPTLDITGTKVKKWMDFVQDFRPLIFPSFPDPAISFPIDEVLPKLQTGIPILLPDKDYFGGRNFSISSSENCYSVDVYMGPAKYGKGGQSGAGYQGSFSACRVDNRTKRAERYYNSVFRKIVLADGIQGTYTSTCGASCTCEVQWGYQEILYTISSKGRGQRSLVKIANDMIKAGPRSQ